MAINFNHAGNAIVSSTGAASITFPNTNLTCFKNRIINGGMTVHQLSTSVSTSYTVPAVGSTPVPNPYISYSIDRWFIVPTGAAVSTTLAAITGASPNAYAQQITGATGITSIAFGQRIEQLNSWDLAGNSVMISFWMANSLLTSVAWKVSYANTADAFGTFAGTGFSSTTTTISSGNINGLQVGLQYYSFKVDIPSAATTGIELLFTAGAQTSGTWSISNVQLEKGTIASEFELRPVSRELQMCGRYTELLTGYNTSGYNASASGTNYLTLFFKTKKRIAPATASISGNTLTLTNAGTPTWGASTIDAIRLDIVNTAAGMWSIVTTGLGYVCVEL